ncbi:hypothetical protein BS78_03G168000 [Paspalum vaginatum]|nr:hypothetical protein BS78_03G168000 [Paspalum vaginatum]
MKKAASRGPMRITAWNCRGLGNASAVRGLLDLQKHEFPDILFLSETKMDRERIERFRWILQMPNVVVKDYVGYKGGIALFWKRDVDVTLKSISKYHIDVVVKEEDGRDWRLTGIYGQPRAEEKEKTWRLMRILNNLYKKPWLCLGDFNEILFRSQKEGGLPRADFCMERFRNTLEDCRLKDLGCEGDIFTWWNHHHEARSYIKERLDRAVACNEWRDTFPLVRVINGDPQHSDHKPITVDCGDKENLDGCFVRDVSPKFEATWLEEEGCWRQVENAWAEALEAGDANMFQIQKKILGELHNWDRNVLDELEKMISQRTEEVLSCMERRVSRAMNENLLKTFTGEEVEETLRSIGDLKAPGPDGIPLVFYKRFWSLVGEQVKKEVLAVQNGVQRNDFLAWHLDPKGNFSVKSAYVLGTKIKSHQNQKDASTSSSEEGGFDWGKIWRLDLPNKVKMFVWRMAHNALQVKLNIARRGVDLDTICPMCSRFDEDPEDTADADDPLPWILLDVRAYIADHRNATTTCIELNDGHQIQITVCTAPPPLVSYICAWSLNTDPDLIFPEEPTVRCVNGDLLFLRVYSVETYDLVYQAGVRPSLKLIPDAVVRGQVYLHSLRTIAFLRRGHRAGSSSFYVCSLDQHIDFRDGHSHLCLYEVIDGDGKWSEDELFLDQLHNPPDRITTFFHSTEKVITLDDEQGVVAFVDLAQGIIICNVLADGKPASYLPLPPDLINHNRKGCSLLNWDIAIINGLLTVVRLRNFHDSDTGRWSWDLSKWSKPVAGLDDNKEDWHHVCMVLSDDVSVYDNTYGVDLLLKLEDQPAIASMPLSNPTLNLTDANVVYVMGKVRYSDAKAVVLTVDMANKRILMVSMYDAEKIMNDFDYAYTPARGEARYIDPGALATGCCSIFHCK